MFIIRCSYKNDKLSQRDAAIIRYTSIFADSYLFVAMLEVYAKHVHPHPFWFRGMWRFGGLVVGYGFLSTLLGTESTDPPPVPLENRSPENLTELAIRWRENAHRAEEEAGITTQ